MLEMASSPEKRRRMGACAVAKIRSHYSWNGKVGQMIEFYDAARRSGALVRAQGRGPSRLMRILILSDVSGFMPGGVPAETRELIGGLARRGHELAFAGDVPVTEAPLARHFPITIPIGRSFRRQVAAILDDVQARICPCDLHELARRARARTPAAPAPLGAHRAFRVPLRAQVQALSPPRGPALRAAVLSLPAEQPGVALGPEQRQGAAGDRAQRLRRAGRRTLRLSGATRSSSSRLPFLPRPRDRRGGSVAVERGAAIDHRRRPRAHEGPARRDQGIAGARRGAFRTCAIS